MRRLVEAESAVQHHRTYQTAVMMFTLSPHYPIIIFFESWKVLLGAESLIAR